MQDRRAGRRRVGGEVQETPKELRRRDVGNGGDLDEKRKKHGQESSAGSVALLVV